MLKDFRKDKRGVFGLTAVQQFFIVILGIALLAYVIIIIMGTLNSSTIIPSQSNTVINETGSINATTAYVVQHVTDAGFTGFSVNVIYNSTAGVVSTTNYTVNANGSIVGVGNAAWPSALITYNFGNQTRAQSNLNNILSNTSTGITSFFGAISPVYAILAVLVIILVLVVLVRVVSGGQEGQRQSSVPL